MAAARFVERLNEQIAQELAASQQYVTNAVYYDAETLPRLAAFFYAQAVEERNHAMMMVRDLLDADAPAISPGVTVPESQFADIVAPVALALLLTVIERSSDSPMQVEDYLVREHGGPPAADPTAPPAAGGAL